MFQIFGKYKIFYLYILNLKMKNDNSALPWIVSAV